LIIHEDNQYVIFILSQLSLQLSHSGVSIPKAVMAWMRIALLSVLIIWCRKMLPIPINTGKGLALVVPALSSLNNLESESCSDVEPHGHQDFNDILVVPILIVPGILDIDGLLLVGEIVDITEELEGSRTA
jgi:hypothetical protein